MKLLNKILILSGEFAAVSDTYLGQIPVLEWVGRDNFCMELPWYGEVHNDWRDDGLNGEAAGTLEIKIKNSCSIW